MEDEGLVVQRMSVKRNVWGHSKTVHSWSPHSRQTLIVEGQVRFTGIKFFCICRNLGF